MSQPWVNRFGRKRMAVLGAKWGRERPHMLCLCLRLGVCIGRVAARRHGLAGGTVRGAGVHVCARRGYCRCRAGGGGSVGSGFSEDLVGLGWQCMLVRAVACSCGAALRRKGTGSPGSPGCRTAAAALALSGINTCALAMRCGRDGGWAPVIILRCALRAGQVATVLTALTVCRCSVLIMDTRWRAHPCTLAAISDGLSWTRALRVGGGVVVGVVVGVELARDLVRVVLCPERT